VLPRALGHVAVFEDVPEELAWDISKALFSS
jgi:hypothetical protein